jgi:hypothetical protein
MVSAGLELTSGMRLKVFLGGQSNPGHKAGEFALKLFHLESVTKGLASSVGSA